MENLNLSTEAQRFDQIEALRNEIRPNKSYEVKDRAIENLKHTTLIAPVHDHEVKFSFIGFNPTPLEFKTTGTWTAQLETELRQAHADKHGDKQPPTLLDLIASTQINQALNELITREQNDEDAEHETN